MPSRFLDLFTHIIITVDVEDIRYQFKCVLVVLHVLVKSCKVESVCQIVFINVAEVFVAATGEKLYGLSVDGP